jgi:phosphate starvation-inducible protein PhoH
MGRSKRNSSSFDNSYAAPKKTRNGRVDRYSNTEVAVPVTPQVKKNFHLKDLKKVDPLTDNQARAFDEWDDGQNLVLKNYAGTGKTFLALSLALEAVLDPETEQDKIVLIRSTVQGRDQGFLPGTEEEKQAPFEAPYEAICNELFTWKNSYHNLKEIGIIEFESTSFLRGRTFNNTVIIFDEFQNETEQVQETVLTRMGKNSRIILCGDGVQEDINNSGFANVSKILQKMKSVSIIEFELEDIVRSGFAREYLMAKYGKK